MATSSPSAANSPRARAATVAASVLNTFKRNLRNSFCCACDAPMEKAMSSVNKQPATVFFLPRTASSLHWCEGDLDPAWLAIVFLPGARFLIPIFFEYLLANAGTSIRRYPRGQNRWCIVEHRLPRIATVAAHVERTLPFNPGVESIPA